MARKERSIYVERQFRKMRRSGVSTSKAVRRISSRLFISERTVYSDIAKVITERSAR